MKELTIEHFRCFKQLNIKFKSGINLLVGDNASGKTSILRACKYVLSSFFAGFSDENTRWISPDSSDFRRYEVMGVRGMSEGIYLHFALQLDTFTHEKLTLSKKSSKNSRSLVTGINEYKQFSKQLMESFFTEEGQQKPLPLLASFTTEDIHASRSITKNKFTNYTPPASFGYYECLEGDGFLPYWKKRMLSLQERRKNLEEIDIVRQTLLDALGPNGCGFLQDMEVSNEKRAIYYIFSDGREIDDENLSDGYKRIINIVTDMAFRCAILNRGIYGTDTCKKTAGTVLIDEIDLHLHPDLQVLILPKLQAAFPNIQIIASTHSPMVMSSIEPSDTSVVYHLDYSSEAQEYSITPINTFGMDSSSIMDVKLQLPKRNPATEIELQQLALYIDKGQYDEAASYLDMLVEKYNDNLPEFTSAATRLHFLRTINETNH